MIILIAALIGAIIGGLLARHRKGRAADIAQYSIVFAMLFALTTLIALVAIARVAA